MSVFYPRPFGRYWLLKALAEGGMGALHLAATGDPGLEKLCVIKTVLPQKSDDEYLARFNSEAQVVVRLSHGNLVPVLDVGHVDEQLYLAMDYVEGKDLREVWNQCSREGVGFPIDVAVYIIREVLRGLAYAHHAPGIRLVHRDVSPHNILLSFTGEVKLADFGLAKSTLSTVETETGVIYGKLAYMSPEQARAEEVDSRSDIYAAGIVLWELLTGRRLFPGETVESRREQEIPPPSSLAPALPRELDGLVLRALRVRPEERYPDAESMRAALAGWLGKAAPTTDAARLTRFLTDLFGETIAAQREETQQLLRVLRGRTVPPVAQTPPSNASPPRLARGVLVDERYLLKRVLGEGGMGEVWEAEHTQIGRLVAIKFLRHLHARGPQAVAAFRQEARAASRIGHPNVADVTDAGKYGDTLYLVMELLQGRTLQDELAAEGPRPVLRALLIAQQVAETLAAAHREGVVHRDLKPANIFLLAGGEHRLDDAQLNVLNASGPVAPLLKVLDFGIALSLSAEESRRVLDGQIAGTLDYMAPEQLSSGAVDPAAAPLPRTIDGAERSEARTIDGAERSEARSIDGAERSEARSIDHRADIYSLGVVIYEMLSGQRPFQGRGQSAEEIRARKLSEDPPPLPAGEPALPAMLVTLVMSMLHRDPGGRPGSMPQVVEALAQVRSALVQPPVPEARSSRSATTGPLEPREPSPPPAEPDRRPQPLRAFLLGAALIAAVGVGVLLAPDVLQRSPRDGALEAPADAGGSPDLRRPPDLAPAADMTPPPRPPTADLAPPLSPHVPSLGPPISQAEAEHFLVNGNAALGRGQLQAAAAACKDAQRHPRVRCRALVCLADIAWESGDYRHAEQNGERAVRCHGAGTPAHLIYGNALLKNGKPQKAREQYQRVLRIDPDNTAALRGIEKTR